MQNKSAYVWNFSGQVIPQVIFLITNIILARYLSPADFGIIGIITIFISIAGTLADAGFGGSLIYEKDICAKDISTVFCYNSFISIILYVIIFFISPFLENFYNCTGLSEITRTLSLVFIINAFSIIPRSLLIREIRFRVIAKINCIASFFAAITAVGLALYGVKTYSLVFYQLVLSLINCIGLAYIIRYKPNVSFNYESFKKLFSFGFFTTVTNIIDSIYENIITMLFGKLLSIKSAGYFYQAKKLETASTNSMVLTLNSVSFPILTKLKEDESRFKNEANSVFTTSTLLLFPLLGIVSVFSEQIIILIFGKEWVPSAPYLSVLMYVGAFYIMETLLRNNLKSLGRIKLLATATFIKRSVGLLLIISGLLISPFWMLYGYLASTIVGYIINLKIYTTCSNQRFIKLLIAHIGLIIPSVTIILALSFINWTMESLIVSIFSAIILVSFCYLFVMPKVYGVSILKFFKNAT